MDKYQRIKVLGRGSYGSAVLVREKGGSRQFRVIKEIDTSRLPVAAQREAQTEVDVLKALSHPNIVAYCDRFNEGTKLCIVMEFADNGDLAAAVRERQSESRPYPEGEALRIFAQCCLALRHVHSKHVLHRDLKSQNIFMTKAQVVKLGDFGIAKVLDHTAAEAMTMIGTPIYLAPEVCNSSPYGIKADVWSLGVVLYELFALKPPFQGNNIASLCMKIMRTEPEPLPELYSEEARDLVAWMLRKAPEKRPSVDQLLAQDAVHTIATGLPGGGALAEGKLRDALDGFLANAGKPPSSAPQQPSDAMLRVQAGSPCDLAAEFHRNRELAAMLKARAEGGPGIRPPGLPRSHSADPAARSPRQDEPRRDQRASEGGHLQALQDAAAQARRDRRQVQQRMKELERVEAQAPPGEPAEGAGAGRAPRRTNSVDSAAAKRCAEEEHLQALQEAAAQARRDRRQVQQRVQELERAAGGDDPARDRTSRHGHNDHERGSPRPRNRHDDEAQHLQALQEAAAQARRDRRQVQQRVQELERAAGGGDPARDHTNWHGHNDHERGSPRPRNRHDDEAQHLQALQEAAAQARRDRKQVQQRVQEQERATGGSDLARDHWSGHKDHERGSIEARAANQQDEEARHLQALQEAAAEARRERKALQQKMRELDEGQCERAQAPAGAGSGAEVPSGGRGSGAAEARARQEADHLRALQEAAAEVRRERKALQQRHREAEHEAEAAPPQGAEEGTDEVGSAQGSPGGAAGEARRAAEEADHLRALQEAAAEARRERRALQQRRREAEFEADGGAPEAARGPAGAESALGTADETPHWRAPEQRPRSGEVELDKTRRRSTVRSALSFAGGLMAGSRAGSSSSSRAALREDEASPSPLPPLPPGPEAAALLGPGTAAFNGTARLGETLSRLAAAHGLEAAAPLGPGPEAFNGTARLGETLSRLAAAHGPEGHGGGPAAGVAPPSGHGAAGPAAGAEGRGAAAGRALARESSRCLSAPPCEEPAADAKECLEPSVSLKLSQEAHDEMRSCVAEMNSKDCDTLGSLSYTVTGSLSALSCIATP